MEGSGCTIKWQTDKKPSSHSIADVFLTEAAALAAFDSIASFDSASEAHLHPESGHEATDPQTSLRLAAQEATQPGTLRSCEILYINGKPFQVPLEYSGSSPATDGDVHSSTPIHILACSGCHCLSSDFTQMCLLHPGKYICLCITQNTSFFAISGCRCTAVNCMYSHGSLACNWLRSACQLMGQFSASAPTKQRPFGCGTTCTVSQWWHAVHVQCRLFVEGHYT